MYQHILIPVDLSEHSKTSKSLAVANALSGKDTRITLLHVLENIPVYVSQHVSLAVMQSIRETMTQRLTELANTIPDCEMAFSEGRPGSQIAQWASEHKVDCIVMASHQPAFSDILLGSVARHVVAHAKCAVHVLR